MCVCVCVCVCYVMFRAEVSNLFSLKSTNLHSEASEAAILKGQGPPYA